MENEKCGKSMNCTNDESTYSHYCPYQSEMSDNNYENYCKCCSECTYECEMDV